MKWGQSDVRAAFDQRRYPSDRTNEEQGILSDE
jgi:hypothetical protein